jgi:hypothetical protein
VTFINTLGTLLREGHYQIDHVLIDRKQHFSILDVQSFRRTDGDTDYCLVFAEVRERLALSKQTIKKMDMERFNHKNLNDGEVKEQYRVTIRNKYAALENLKDNGDIKRAWGAVSKNIKILAKDSIGHCKSKHQI